MLCANCSDIDLIAILKGNHEGIPLKKGHEVWITRSSDPTTIWIWKSQSGCEFCEFILATKVNLFPRNESLQPRYLQLDRGKSLMRVFTKSGPVTKLSSHVNIFYDFEDRKPELQVASHPSLVVPFGVSAEIKTPELQPSPLRVNEVPTWLHSSATRQYLQNCLTHHSTCNQQKETFSGRPSQLRVIDCHTRAIVRPSGDIPYAALSYRWGKSNGESHDLQTDILPARLPSTVEDAIRVTQSLGIRYLWIDAYCVLQKNEDDFKHQIRQMHLIYRSAQITIIADGDADASSGLLGVSIPRGNVQTKGRYNELNLVTFSPWPWALVYYTEGWFRRGWTLQEGYFSRRRLIFTEKQVLFDCDEGVISEDLQHSQIRYHSMLEKWQPNVDGETIYDLIESYTERALTYDVDILNAFDGILGEFEQQEPPIRSYWGIPLPFDTSGYLNGLLIGLCWRHDIQNEKVNRRLGFPSCSWAGWLHNPNAVYHIRRTPNTTLVVPKDLAILFEKKDGILQSLQDFEKASPNSTQRHHYSQRIFISAPSFKVMLRKRAVVGRHLGRVVHGHDASVLRGGGHDYWSEMARLDCPFENLKFSHVGTGAIEIRTCYAIFLFRAVDMKDRYNEPVETVFAFLLVSRIGTNWERVGLWLQPFKAKAGAEDPPVSSSYKKRDFWIA